MVTAYVYAAHAAARILETMYRAARPGALGDQVDTLAGAGRRGRRHRPGPAVITSVVLRPAARQRTGAASPWLTA